MSKADDGIKVLSVNRKARYNYAVQEAFECGIELVGTEVKSMKEGRFSYAAAFDADPFARALAAEEYARRGVGRSNAYKGIRPDVPPDKAAKLLLWMSQGFLQEKLNGGTANPEALRSEFEDWIDLMERLLRE